MVYTNFGLIQLGGLTRGFWFREWKSSRDICWSDLAFDSFLSIIVSGSKILFVFISSFVELFWRSMSAITYLKKLIINYCAFSLPTFEVRQISSQLPTIFLHNYWVHYLFQMFMTLQLFLNNIICYLFLYRSLYNNF